ncbi:MAG: SPOR domain-containing protein [Magnetococcus sp. DMHC-6]
MLQEMNLSGSMAKHMDKSVGHKLSRGWMIAVVIWGFITAVTGSLVIGGDPLDKLGLWLHKTPSVPVAALQKRGESVVSTPVWMPPSGVFPPIALGPYMVLAGSFEQPDRADHVLQRLHNKEIPAIKRQFKLAGKSDLTHVLIGPFKQRQEAEQALQIIQSRTGILAELIQGSLMEMVWKPEVLPPPKPIIENKPKPIIENKPKPIIENKPKPIIENKPKPIIENKPKPIIENKPPPPVFVSGQYLVSAGTFLDGAMAKSVMDRLVHLGLKVQMRTETVGEHPFVQVLVGEPKRDLEAVRKLVLLIQEQSGILSEVYRIP